MLIDEPILLESDTLPVLISIPVPVRIDGSIDLVGHKLNFLEDYLGRFNKTIDFDKAKIAVAARLLGFAGMSKDDFIKGAKEHMSINGDLFDRFLNHIWHTYISKVDNKIVVLTIESSEGIFQIYRSMMKDFEIVSNTRCIKNWPHLIPDDKEIEDF